MAEKITIQLNGEPRAIDGNLTAHRLLASLRLDARTVVVELNREIIRKHQLDDTLIRQGDQVELVHFVGGG